MQFNAIRIYQFRKHLDEMLQPLYLFRRLIGQFEGLLAEKDSCPFGRILKLSQGLFIQLKTESILNNFLYC